MGWRVAPPWSATAVSSAKGALRPQRQSTLTAWHGAGALGRTGSWLSFCSLHADALASSAAGRRSPLPPPRPLPSPRPSPFPPLCHPRRSDARRQGLPSTAGAAASPARAGDVGGTTRLTSWRREACNCCRKSSGGSSPSSSAPSRKTRTRWRARQTPKIWQPGQAPPGRPRRALERWVALTGWRLAHQLGHGHGLREGGLALA